MEKKAKFPMTEQFITLEKKRFQGKLVKKNWLGLF